MAEPTLVPALPDGVISEWRPSRAAMRAWSILSIPVLLVALSVYLAIASHWSGQISGKFNALELAVALLLSLVLMSIHEGIHGAAILAFGGRPRFGVAAQYHIPIALSAAAPGCRFVRSKYLVICLAPTVLLAITGAILCWLPFGGYLVVPFAAQLSGCTGDWTVAWRALRTPAGTVCEDMANGTRFWKGAA